jgi:predicted nucleotidyltransferase
LKELNPTLRGAPPDLKFHFDAEALALGLNYTFQTSEGDVDFLGLVEPLGGYEEIAKKAETVMLGNISIQVISLEDLITIKSYLGRPKDRDSLMHLLAIQRIRDEGNLPGAQGQS